MLSSTTSSYETTVIFHFVLFTISASIKITLLHAEYKYISKLSKLHVNGAAAVED